MANEPRGTALHSLELTYTDPYTLLLSWLGKCTVRANKHVTLEAAQQDRNGHSQFVQRETKRGTENNRRERKREKQLAKATNERWARAVLPDTKRSNVTYSVTRQLTSFYPPPLPLGRFATNPFRQRRRPPPPPPQPPLPCHIVPGIVRRHYRYHSSSSSSSSATHPPGVEPPSDIFDEADLDKLIDVEVEISQLGARVLADPAATREDQYCP